MTDNATVVRGADLVIRIRQLAGPSIRLSLHTPNAEAVRVQFERGEADLIWARYAACQEGMPTGM